MSGTIASVASHGTMALAVRELGVVVGSRTILSRVAFSVAAGEVLVVLGPNGSGKTTLLEAIAGLRPGQLGMIEAEGTSLNTFSDRCRCIAYMPDDEHLPEETTLGTALGLHDGDPLVATFELQQLLGARATEVSRGEAKRARLCATLSLRRPVVLLDEPFAAFDPRQLRDVLPLFRSALQSSAAIVTVHQMRTAELVADRLLLLADGRVVATGTLDELRRAADLPQATLDDVFLQLLDRGADDASA